MSDPIRQKAWSPYIVGIAIGMLSWFAFATADHPLGITTAFENVAALSVEAVAPSIAEQPAGLIAKKNAEGKPPKIGWEVMLVIGVFFGAIASAVLGKDRHRVVVPPLWRWRFGESKSLRLAVAFLAGAQMMFGARLAQGCTSGHGISGTLQLAVSSWLFIVVAFAVATITTFVLYSKEGGNHV